MNRRQRVSDRIASQDRWDQIRAEIAEKKRLAEENFQENLQKASGARSVQLQSTNPEKAMPHIIIHPSSKPEWIGKYQLTYFNSDMLPFGDSMFETMEEALKSASGVGDENYLDQPYGDHTFKIVKTANRKALFTEEELGKAQENLTPEDYGDQGDFVESFTTEDGSEYYVYFKAEGDCVYHITFALITSKTEDGRPEKITYYMQHNKRSFEVMQNVVAAIKMFMDSAEWRKVVFTSDREDESRFSLYTKLVQKLGYPWFTLSRSSDSIVFVIENPNYDGECDGTH
jgi:hypothetical protein